MSSSGSPFLQLDEEKLVPGPEPIVIQHVRERASECGPLGIVRNPDRIGAVIQNIDLDQRSRTARCAREVESGK